MTLASTVVRAARTFGDRPAFVASGGWSLSYAELDRLSDEAAAGLAARGLAEGDLLALVLPSTPDYVVAYAAAAKLGAVTAGVNPRYTAAERAAVLEVARPALVLATPELAPEGAGADLVTVDPGRGAEEVLAGVRAAGAAPRPLADDPGRLVTVVFTSGTTGLPKGAVFGNAELAAVARADLGDRAGTWGGGGPMLAATAFAHIGFMTKLPWYLQAGHTIHLLDRWRAGDVLRLVSDQRMPSVGGVAPQLALLLQHPDFDRYDLDCVRTIVMGGALSPPALVEEARRRFGAAYSIRYSSTESGGVGTATAFDADDDEALASVGRPRGDVEVAIRHPDTGARLPSGTIGEVTLRSSCQLRGYRNDPDATDGVLRRHRDTDPADLLGPDARPDPTGGRPWLHTGDLGSVDERGLLRLAGRLKEMFIRGGYNVYPLEVEAVLASHPDVADVAVVPRPDPVMGEIGTAVVVPRRPGEPPSLADLRAFAADRLAAYKLPEAIRVVDRLPLTAMQKVDRRALAAVEAGTSR